jgi:hypothetical protein
MTFLQKIGNTHWLPTGEDIAIPRRSQRVFPKKGLFGTPKIMAPRQADPAHSVLTIPGEQRSEMEGLKPLFLKGLWPYLEVSQKSQNGWIRQPESS